jgi:hypothetical protein
MGKSAIQRIKELDAERTKLLEQAKEEALLKANEAVAELNALGFNYQLTIAKRRKSGTEKELEIKDGSCAICGFSTSPSHDTVPPMAKEKSSVYGGETRTKGSKYPRQSRWL